MPSGPTPLAGSAALASVSWFSPAVPHSCPRLLGLDTNGTRITEPMNGTATHQLASIRSARRSAGTRILRRRSSARFRDACRHHVLGPAIHRALVVRPARASLPLGVATPAAVFPLAVVREEGVATAWTLLSVGRAVLVVELVAGHFRPPPPPPLPRRLRSPRRRRRRRPRRPRRPARARPRRRR